MEYMPEGFTELNDYLRSIEGTSVTTAQIQYGLNAKHGFTSGKITGIIKRAEDRKLLTRIRRSTYSFDLYGADDVLDLADLEITATISNIEKIMSAHISSMSTAEFEKMKKKIDLIKQALQINM